MNKRKKISLIDGSGFIFRAYYALPPLTSKNGKPVFELAHDQSKCLWLNGKYRWMIGESSECRVSLPSFFSFSLYSPWNMTWL